MVWLQDTKNCLTTRSGELSLRAPLRTTPPGQPMTTALPSKSSLLRRTLLTSGLFIGYLITFGIGSAIQRHIIAGGRLLWIGSIPGVSLLLNVYLAPAMLLACIPGLNAILELSESFWWPLFDPPDTTA
jgi:hypothetical protein